MDRELFGRIFQDVQIFDIDFSQWSRHLRLYVVGVDAVLPLPPKLPLFVVEFQQVSDFSCSFRHQGVPLGDPETHIQWGIHDYSVEEGDELEIALAGSGRAPHLNIKYREIEAWRIENEKVNALFPGWSRPGAPLARPGIEEMILAGHSSALDLGAWRSRGCRHGLRSLRPPLPPFKVYGRDIVRLRTD